MKNLNLIASGLFLSIISISAVLDDPRNPPLGRTGAPTELTCQSSECHRGGSFTGTVNLTGLPDTVKANEKYTLTITQASNALRGGFEVTSLDGQNTRAGTFATKDNTTNVSTQGGRQYIRQARAVLLSNGSVSWTFDWTAPASLTTGDTIRFYFVSLAANNDDRETNDNVLVNAKTVKYNQNLAVDNLSESEVYDFFVRNSQLSLSAKSTLKSLHVSNLNGLEVYKAKELQSNQNLNIELKTGIYILSLVHESGQTFTKKIIIE